MTREGRDFGSNSIWGRDTAAGCGGGGGVNLEGCGRAVEDVVADSPLRHCGCRIEQKLLVLRFVFGTKYRQVLLFTNWLESGSSITLLMSSPLLFDVYLCADFGL